MFKKWRVITSIINMADGESDTVTHKDTQKEAMDFFYDQCSKIGGNAQTKGVEVIVVRPDGGIHRIEQIDNAQYLTAEPVEE